MDRREKTQLALYALLTLLFFGLGYTLAPAVTQWGLHPWSQILDFLRDTLTKITSLL